MTTTDIDWTFDSQDMHTTITVEVPAGAADDAPLVVLLHGLAGTAEHMSDPGSVFSQFARERVVEHTTVDRGTHNTPGPPLTAFNIDVDPQISVRSWTQFLTGQGFPILNYSQIDPRERLARTTAECIAVLRAIEAQQLGTLNDPVLEPIKDRRIVIIGHSRGGVLARQVLVDLDQASDPTLQRISTCITLHSPHSGSTLANTANLIESELPRLQALVDALDLPAEIVFRSLAIVADALSWVKDFVGAPAYDDIAVGSPVLAALRDAEPVAGIEYFTFGGSRPVFANVREWLYTHDSSFPRPILPLTFDWRTFYHTLLPLLPPGLFPFPETTNGDFLTHPSMTNLPFSTHRNNWINHAEALWDPTLQTQVLSVLNTPPAAPLRAILHETGLNRVLHHVQRQRPSLFNYATESFLGHEEHFCQPIEVDPRVEQAGDPIFTVQAPIPVLGTPYPIGLNWCLQITNAEIDFHPGSHFALPPELDPLADQRLALRLQACFALECPPPEFIDEQLEQIEDVVTRERDLTRRFDDLLPDPSDRPKPGDPPKEKEPPPTVVPPLVKDELKCFCLEIYMVGHCEWATIGQSDTRWLKWRVDQVEIVDISPSELEDTVECWVWTVLKLGILPRLSLSSEALILDVTRPLREAGLHVDQSVRIVPALMGVSDNPSIENDELRVFMNLQVRNS